jgi:hypothetical protein
MSARTLVAALALCVLPGGRALDGAQPLILNVSPALARAPGYLRVSARIEPDVDNRMLLVTATSEDYSRSSEIPLNGARAPRLSVVDYPGLPSGVYEVRAVLIGAQGRRAGATRTVQFIPMTGEP